ncbi:hypothetical protein [Cohnella sp. GCM10027633]|uniref:hypothetical protein n=1 Tax=unclassified Cohnella TaxID=2636738 RepID=UPI0036336C19
MIRRGEYAVYNKKVYSVGKKSDDWVNLISHDPNDLFDGFNSHPLDSTVFVKKVKTQDLDQIYFIETSAVYQGVQLSVGDVKDEKVLLGTSELKLVEHLDFDKTDKYYYEKWVDINDVQFIEEKKSAVL